MKNGRTTTVFWRYELRSALQEYRVIPRKHRFKNGACSVKGYCGRVQRHVVERYSSIRISVPKGGDINRIGAPRVDWVAPVATGSCAQLPPGDGPARREQGGRAARGYRPLRWELVRTMAQGCQWLFGSAAISGGEPEVSGLWAWGPIAGGVRLAVQCC